MNSKSYALATALLLLAASGCRPSETRPPVIDESSVRTTRSGSVVGFTGEYGSHAWLGIPYAKPPVGPLRWRAPQPPEAWSGRREALRFGSPCVQYASAFGGVTSAKPGTPVGSEDCLFLNIWAPRHQDSPGAARVPVMLWIHGGGNTIGEGGFYNGGNLAQSQNLVVLTFNYRLGPFGWFRHAALRASAGNDEDRSGNFGTLDLIRALEWIRDNIESFGGDPNNVTIFGESAGGQNVYQLLLSPKASGLFHRAIVQSGGMMFNSTAEAENFTDDAEAGEEGSSNETLLNMLLADGKAKDRAGAKAALAAMSPTDVEHFLRSKSGFDFLGMYPQFLNTGMIRLPKPFRDGTVLPTSAPMQLLAEGKFNRVPIITGTNRDENKVFMFGNPQRVTKLLWLIPRVRDQRTYDLSAEYLAKSWKATSVDEPATVISKLPGARIFAYRFDWDEEPTIFGADLSRLLGAAHGFEIPFVFGHFNLGKEGNQIFTEENEASRRELAAQMMSYWAQFAYSGDPARGRDGNLPPWKSWNGSSPEAEKFLLLDTTRGGGIRMSNETVSNEGLLASVAADPRLTSALERCRVYRELADWGRGLAKAHYATLAECKAYPYEGYPWEN